MEQVRGLRYVGVLNWGPFDEHFFPSQLKFDTKFILLSSKL